MDILFQMPGGIMQVLHIENTDDILRQMYWRKV